MAIVTIKDLLEAGVHYGHRTSRWDPKMGKYIFGKRNSIHIIDLRETVRGLVTAYRFLRQVRAKGDYVLFVGTKRQAMATVKAQADALGQPSVTNRWLGGMLTNFKTIRNRLKRLEEIETMEESGQFRFLSKKMISMLTREKRKILANLEGVRNMSRLPGAIVVVDPLREHNAVHEANLLGIPIVALLDTDADPDDVDIIIPGNDDALRSIQLVIGVLGKAVEEGESLGAKVQPMQPKGPAEAPVPEEQAAVTPPQEEAPAPAAEPEAPAE